jgi:hypothetical protein
MFAKEKSPAMGRAFSFAFRPARSVQAAVVLIPRRRVPLAVGHAAELAFAWVSSYGLSNPFLPRWRFEAAVVLVPGRRVPLAVGHFAELAFRWCCLTVTRESDRQRSSHKQFFHLACLPVISRSGSPGCSELGTTYRRSQRWAYVTIERAAVDHTREKFPKIRFAISDSKAHKSTVKLCRGISLRYRGSGQAPLSPRSFANVLARLATEGLHSTRTTTPLESFIEWSNITPT